VTGGAGPDDRPSPFGQQAGARDVLGDRRLLVDSVLPPVVFVVANALGGLRVAAGAAVGLAVVTLTVRLLRRQRLLYAASGLTGVLLGVVVALVAGDADGYFLPGIVSNAALGVACVVSVLARRPLVAFTSAAIYRWPLEWYWHPLVRPAYSEITWLWAAYYAAKTALAVTLYRSDATAALGVVRIVTGWPALALLLLVTYVYVERRLRRLGGPSVDDYRAAEQRVV
jgi:hypothetical protein